MPLGSLSILELAVAVVMLFAGSTVLSTVGFGIGMTTTPVLLLLLEPQAVVVVVNTVSLALFVLIIRQTRDHISVRETAPLGIAGLLGVPVGVFILSEASASALRISITGLIILLTLAVVFNLRGPIPRSNLVGAVVAFVVAVLLTSLGIGGPLMALLLLTRGWTPQAVRGSLALYFLTVEAAGVVGYGVAGLFTTERIALILITAVPALMGFWLATRLLRGMNETVFRRATIAVIIATSLMVLGREVAAL